MPPNGSAGSNIGQISTQNIGSPNGNNPTSLSTVAATYLVGAYDTCAVQITGSYTGDLSVQVQLDNGTWVTITNSRAIINAITGAASASIAGGAIGVYQFNISGFSGVRVTALGPITGTATVTLIPTAGNGVITFSGAPAVSFAESLIASKDNITTLPRGANYVNVTATGVISAIPCKLLGILINTTTAGVTTLNDNASAPSGSAPVTGLILPVGLHNFYGLRFQNGIYYTEGGDQNITFLIDPTQE